MRLTTFYSYTKIHTRTRFEKETVLATAKLANALNYWLQNDVA